MRYEITKPYIAKSFLWCSELIKHSLLSYVIGNINKAEHLKCPGYS
jgi:hypothetical protein